MPDNLSAKSLWRTVLRPVRMASLEGFEPTTHCLEGCEDKRRRPLASFLKGIVAWPSFSVNMVQLNNLDFYYSSELMEDIHSACVQT